MVEIVKVNPKDYGLEADQASSMTKGLVQILDERAQLADRYKEVIKLEITEENIPYFKELRLKIRDNRTKGIETWHKAHKEFYLRGGQFIDATKRVEVIENERMEGKLKEMEDFFINQENERKKALYDKRLAELEVLGFNGNGMPLDSMEEDSYAVLLSGAKESYKEKLRIEAEAEKERIRIEKENALHIERKEQLLAYWNFVSDKFQNFGALEDKDFKAILKEVKAAKKSYDDEQEKIKAENARLTALAEEQRKESEAKLKAEEDEKNRLAAELKRKQDEEAAALKEKQDREAKEKAEAEKLAKAPVKNQLNSWIDLFTVPQFSGDVENEVYMEIQEKFDGFLKWARKKVEEI